MKERAEQVLNGILEGILRNARETGTIRESQLKFAIQIYEALARHGADVEPIDAEFRDMTETELIDVVSITDKKKGPSSP